MRSKIKLDELSIFFIIILVIVQNLFSNGLYLFVCYASGIFLFNRLSQPYKPGVFTVIALNHLLQIVAGVWLANFLDKDINYRSYNTGYATLLSITGLIFLVAPIIYQQDKIKRLSLSDFKMHAFRLSTQKSLNCYLIALFVTSFLLGIAFLFTGLTQIIISIVKIKWFFFLLFGYQAVSKKEKLVIFYALVAFEFVTGFYSFFSDFKTVVYYLAILLISFVVTINFRQLILFFFFAAVLAFMGVAWTSIKTDYRSFLNKGERSQSVQVSKDEAMDKLISLSNNIDQNSSQGATIDLLDRLQYTFHFAKTMERVPAIIPYQNGSNWLDNIAFATTPRFLNPDKPTIDNSIKTTKYTGIRYATAKQGASFSLGYFAEFYIDFGPFYMMPMLFLMGLFYSRIYKYFLTKASNNPVFNYSLVGAFFFEFYAFEMDGTYIAGRLFASIVTFFVMNFFFTKPLLNYLSVKNN